jgi:ABC-2 type transport system ATP-binding protein
MIEAKGLTKRYGRTVAVDNLSFTVEPGRVTGFLGPNGAGKSTTMRIILGLDRPDSGEVRIDGKRYRELHHPLRMVGALLEAKWVHPNRSARAHLAWLARSNDLPHKRVDEVLDMVGLSAVAGKRAGGFSLGMSQRLGIAAALLGDPQVLMFDEPVNGLDPEGILWIRKFMQSLAAEGRTVFVSSHLLSEMSQTADHLVVIGRGRLIAQCTTQELAERGHTPRQEDGVLVVGGVTTDEVGELAASHGAVLHELTAQRGSLEEAFMQLTGEDVEYHAHRIDGAAPAPAPESLAAPAAQTPATQTSPDDSTVQATQAGTARR